jgi:hypothetical protein
MKAIKANSVLNKLFRSKVKITRRLKAVQSRERKDFHGGGFAKKKIKEAYNIQKSIDEPEEFIPFSKVGSTKARYPVLEYDKDTFNKEIKKGFNLSLNDASEKYVLSELVNHKMMMTPEAYSQNKINAIEWEKYRKVLYNKTELKRLIGKRNKDQTLILESSPEYSANNDFVKEMITRCKKYEKETGKEVSGDKQIRISPHDNYKKELESLKNDRIDGLIGLHKANDKLKALMEAGFMDKSKDISQVFAIIRDEQIGNALNGSLAREPKQLGEKSDEASIDSTVLARLGDENKVKEGVLKLVRESVDQGALTGSYQANFYDLAAFIEGFLEIPENEKKEVIERMERVREIREYEESVLASREDSMIEKRGTPMFSKLSPVERIAYLKHNLHHYQDIFELVKNEKGILEEDEVFASAVVEKLALGYSLKDLFYRNNQYLDLYMVGQPEYSAFLRIIYKHLEKLDFERFGRTLFGLGMIHRREVGQLTEEIYQPLVLKAIEVTVGHMARFNQFVKNVDAANLNKYPLSQMMYNLGVCIEGLLTLGAVNHTTPEPLFSACLKVIESQSQYIEQGCTSNRLLAFVAKVHEIYGMNWEATTSKVLTSIIQNCSNKGLVSSMSQADIEEYIDTFLMIKNLDLPSLPSFPQALQILKKVVQEKHLQSFNLITVNSYLALLSSNNALDKTTKNQIKKCISEALPLSPVLLNYVIPQSLETLAVTDLKQSNEFYEQIDSPYELLLMKSIFGVRPFEYDKTPKFNLYKEMYNYTMIEPEKLQLDDWIHFLDGLVAIELDLDPFEYLAIEKAAEEFLDKEFSLKLSSRLSLLFSMAGFKNMRDKWLRKSLAHLDPHKTIRRDTLVDMLICLDLELLEECEEEQAEMFLGLVTKELPNMKSSLRAVVLWKLAYLDFDAKELEEVVDSIEMSELKTLHKLLLIQTGIPFRGLQDADETELTAFYKFIFSRVSNVIQNDNHSIYNKISESLKEARTGIKRDSLVTKDGRSAFVPLFVIPTKTAFFIYPQDLFLKNIVVKQLPREEYKYFWESTNELPQFFKLNEEIIESMTLDIESMSVEEARGQFMKSDAAHPAAGLDETLKQQRISRITQRKE